MATAAVDRQERRACTLAGGSGGFFCKIEVGWGGREGGKEGGTASYNPFRPYKPIQTDSTNEAILVPCLMVQRCIGITQWAWSWPGCRRIMNVIGTRLHSTAWPCGLLCTCIAPARPLLFAYSASGSFLNCIASLRRLRFGQVTQKRPNQGKSKR